MMGSTYQKLTKEELVVLKSLTNGKTNQEIANEVNLELNTLKSIISSIYKKLMIDNRVQAAILAVKNDLV